MFCYSVHCTGKVKNDRERGSRRFVRYINGSLAANKNSSILEFKQ